MGHKALMKAMGLLKKTCTCAHAHKILYIISATSNSKPVRTTSLVGGRLSGSSREILGKNRGSSQLPLKSCHSKSCLNHKNIKLALPFIDYYSVS